jgi:GntR family transcriptional regulator
MARQVASIRFRLDVRGDSPPYRQLVDQVLNSVQSGRLLPGDRLPSVREVVTQIVINPNTVHRAYRELEHLGVTEARPGLGTFVVSGSEEQSDAAISSVRVLRSWIQKARESGLSDDEILTSVRRRLRESTPTEPVAKTTELRERARTASRRRS